MTCAPVGDAEMKRKLERRDRLHLTHDLAPYATASVFQSSVDEEISPKAILQAHPRGNASWVTPQV